MNFNGVAHFEQAFLLLWGDWGNGVLGVVKLN
jgi:hypothetical protein